MPSTGTLVFNDQKLQAPEMYATESLGVGVSVPTSNLEVVGNAYVSSNLDVGGSLGLTKGSSLFVGDSAMMETRSTRPTAREISRNCYDGEQFRWVCGECEWYT